VFGQTRSISALVSDRQPVVQAAKTSVQHSVEELERLREQLKDILMLK